MKSMYTLCVIISIWTTVTLSMDSSVSRLVPDTEGHPLLLNDVTSYLYKLPRRSVLTLHNDPLFAPKALKENVQLIQRVGRSQGIQKPLACIVGTCVLIVASDIAKLALWGTNSHHPDSTLNQTQHATPQGPCVTKCFEAGCCFAECNGPCTIMCSSNCSSTSGGTADIFTPISSSSALNVTVCTGALCGLLYNSCASNRANLDLDKCLFELKTMTHQILTPLNLYTPSDDIKQELLAPSTQDDTVTSFNERRSKAIDLIVSASKHASGAKVLAVLAVLCGLNFAKDVAFHEVYGYAPQLDHTNSTDTTPVFTRLGYTLAGTALGNAVIGIVSGLTSLKWWHNAQQERSRMHEMLSELDELIINN